MNTRTFKLSALTLALCGLASTALAADDAELQEIEVQQQAQPDNHVAKVKPKTNDITSETTERIEVTGSRLQHGNITSRQMTINADEIKSRGVTSVEELLRTLPQNLSTIGSITNERLRGPLNNRGQQASVSSIGTLGVSAANLGGVGAGQTLILVNGRRLAGAAGIEDGFVNLNGIPISAIERVEISLDGGSAIYGADAMGGVINFILRSNYTGSTVSLQHEVSANDADNTRISLFSGRTWTSGNVSITLEHVNRAPVNNRKSGFVTLDYSDYYNDEMYDLRGFGNGLQPGLITWGQYDADWNYSQTGIKLPVGTNDVPDITDFVPLTDDDKLDFVPKYAGPDSESSSVTLSAEQKITKNLSAFFNGMYNRSKFERELNYSTSSLELAFAPGQYYNPFPAGYFFNTTYVDYTTVQYRPEDEVATGVLPSGRVGSTRTSWNFNTGLSYEFNQDTKLDFIFSKSGASSEGDQYNLSSLVGFIPDPTSPNGLACYNGGLATGSYSAGEIDYIQQAFDKQCQALTSNDPNLAFNPWKSTAESSGSSIRDFYIRNGFEDRMSSMDNYEIRLNGSGYELPAGKIYYAVGGEWHDSGVESREVSNFTGGQISRDMYAIFGEMTIPIFGKDFTLPGAEALLISLAARRDMTKTKGPIGTVDGVQYGPGVELLYADNTFARTTPSIGFHWQPVRDISVRGNWTQGFKAPVYTALFNVSGSYNFTTYISDDPYYNCSEFNDCVYDYGDYKAYIAESYVAPNPDLEPETSDQYSLGLGWHPSGTLRGLNININYHKTVRENEYADLSDLFQLLSTPERLSLEQFYPRDENGKVLQARSMQFNIAGSEFESVTYEVGYRFYTSFGSFEPQIVYLDNLTMETQAFDGGEKISRIGKIGGVDEYKINGSLRYSYQDLTATLYAYYLPEYTNDYLSQMYAGVISGIEYERPVSSYLWFDLTASYQFTDELRVNFAGRNILDKAPPFTVVDQRPYDSARYNAAGRTFSLEVQYEF